MVATLSVPLREVHKDRATDYLNNTARGGFGIKPGLGTADVADAIGLTVPTTHKLLTGLGWAGLETLERRGVCLTSGRSDGDAGSPGNTQEAPG